MIMRLFSRLILMTTMAILMAYLTGCAEDCDKEYQVCLSKIGGSLSRYSYEKTCRYPTMNRGDEKVYCDCEEAYIECDGE